jgi:hypothetical protein
MSHKYSYAIALNDRELLPEVAKDFRKAHVKILSDDPVLVVSSTPARISQILGTRGDFALDAIVPD